MSTNEPMTQEQLDAIRERVGGITDGPWSYWSGRDYRENCVKSDSREDAPTVAEVIPEADDAVFIANAPQDITDLLAEVERLRARLTVDDAMVKRGAFALARRRAEDPLARDRVVGHTLLVDAKAVLNAALGTEEGA